MTSEPRVALPIERLSLNQITTQQWSVREAVDGCRHAGLSWIGLWREKIAQVGVVESARLVREGGLQVSSLCRGGMFPATTAARRQLRIDDNLRAIDEAATLSTGVLVLVCGAAPDRDVDGARAMIEESIATILPYAVACGIHLGIEPLHPVFAADRSAIVTMAQANDIIDRLGSDHLGVVIDVYHVWWDPQLYTQIARSAGRIVGFHINDWTLPMKDPLVSRGMMGDGVIELSRIARAVDAAGYRGPIEVEILNRALWNEPGDAALARMKDRYLALMAES